MANVQEIVDLWNEEQPKYENLGKIVCAFIKDKITDYELLPEIQYRTKELLSIIKKVKKKQSQKEYSYHHLKDKLGIRIICSFQEEMKIIDEFLQKFFTIKEVEYKQENLDFDKLDYVSNHYDAQINLGINEFKKHTELGGFVFEIQVRTLNQHAWSNTAHSLSYKQEKDLPPNLKRKVYRLLSLYELADDEFSSVNKALKEYRDNHSYTLLRKLEGKFYKYAKIDFDREISLNTIDILLSYYENETNINQVINEIDSFITSNEQKFQRIYDENRNRFYEILFLTQPEIFIIWYMLQNNPFTLEDNWANDFEEEDLEQIKTLWGNDL
jgi:ppGpp synthetase/RelA/SpoT-type nucleotidyltranferase